MASYTFYLRSNNQSKEVDFSSFVNYTFKYNKFQYRIILLLFLLNFLFNNFCYNQVFDSCQIHLNNQGTGWGINVCAGDTAHFEVLCPLNYTKKIDSIEWKIINPYRNTERYDTALLFGLTLVDTVTKNQFNYFFIDTLSCDNMYLYKRTHVFANVYNSKDTFHEIALRSNTFCVIYCPVQIAEFKESSRVVCERTGTVDFQDLSNRVPTEWEWTFEGGTPNKSTEKNPKGIRYDYSGNYGVRLIAKNPAGADTIYKPNWIKVLPSPAASNDTIQEVLANIGDTIVLQKCFTGTKYKWKNSKNVVLDSLESFQYVVKKYETIYCTVSQDSFCDATCKYQIKISDKPRIYIPNVITPNEDGYNDYLEVYGNQHQLLLIQVFDRWGNRIFSSQDSMAKWDGTIENQKANPGTYIWMIRYIDLRNNKEKVLSGDVTVIRE